MRQFLLFANFILLLTCQKINAQSNVCNDVLTTKTTHVLNTETRSKLAWLNLVNEKNYEKKKEEANVIVPGYFSGDYKSFSEKRKEYFQEQSYQSDEYESSQELRIGLPTEAYTAWSECLKINGKDLFCYIKNVDSRGATIELCWTPPVGLGGKNLEVINVELEGAKQSTLQNIKTILEGKSSYSLQRKSDNGIIRGVINAKIGNGSYSVNIYIPTMEDSIIHKPIEICSCIGHGGVEGVTFWGPKGEPCAGVKTWGTYSQNCKIVDKLYKCQGHGGVEGVTMWGPENCDCAGIPSWGKYQGNSVNIGTLKTNEIKTLCGCMGKGGVDGLILWGPNGECCGGICTWGYYDSYCK